MKAFKLILKILLVVVFVISLFFNVLIIGSSHGTLLFSHNDLKFKSMVNTSLAATTTSNFLTDDDSGIQISKTTKEDKKTIKESYQIYINKKYKLTYKGIITTKNGDKTDKESNYFKEGTLYTETATSKRKKAYTEKDLLDATLEEINFLQNTLVTDIDKSKEKVKTEFSFSPFYFIGFSYKIKEDDKTTTFSYDLSGKLRKVHIKHTSGKTESYTINYKANKVKLPDLTKF